MEATGHYWISLWEFLDANGYEAVSYTHLDVYKRQVVEAAIAAILTAHGCSLATATAIALVYRGIMFCIPF